jgi:hypothetical protein
MIAAESRFRLHHREPNSAAEWCRRLAEEGHCEVAIGTGTDIGISCVTQAIDGESYQKAGSPRITVVVCDKTGLDKEIWLTAQAQINRIFDQARVDITWIDPRCDSRSSIDSGPPDSPALRSLDSYFMVVVAPEPPSGWPSPHAMGAAPILTGPYPRAYVFYSLVLDFIKKFRSLQSRNSTIGIILGLAIAHELGHLLMPGEAHGYGLMKHFWAYQEWQQALSGNLMFHRDHIRQIEKRLHSK